MTATCVLSAARPGQFLWDGKPQIFFTGRSNVGKSSLLNRLLGAQKIARVSGSPGKTAHVNYFLIDGQYYFVDLPGYGYAKVSKAEKERWANLMEAYFDDMARRANLGVMLVDIRHAPSALDKQMAELFQGLCLPFMVVANKSDKLKPREIDPSLDVIRTALVLDPSVPLVPMSAEKGTGKEDVWDVIRKAIAG